MPGKISADREIFLKPLKIFIIDDEKPHYELLMRSIKKKFSGSLIDYFEDAKEAIERLEHDTPDIIIVDYLLPGMNGLEFLKKLNREKRSIPVVMVTGEGDEDIAIESMKLGAFDYIVKTNNYFDLIPGIISKTLERQKIRDDLWKTEQRFRAIYDHGGLGVSIVDKDGRFVEVNRKLCEMLGFEEKELKELMFIADITHSDDIFEGLTMKKKLWSGEVKTYQREKRYIRRSGETIWVMATSVAVFENSGQIKYIMNLVQDITQRKKNEETIQTLYHQLISTQEMERKKIADKLHDDLGQTLTVLKIGLDQLKIETSPKSECLLDRIEGLTELVQKGAETIRTLTYHLRPPILDDLGLVVSIKSLVNQIKKHANISIEFNASGFKKRLNPEIELTFFRIIEECLTNIVKHSKASRASIRLIHSFPKVIATIEDNGEGFDQKQVSIDSGATRGMGLISIRERVKFFKGQFKISSSRGSGTQIRIEIPLNKVEHE